jgi:protein required for attachment to host cells
MDRISIPANGWVLVCDGAKAQILRNEGDALKVQLATFESFDQKLPAAHDMGSDKPGRVHQSQGPSRSSNAETDPHEEGEQDFIVQTVARLDALVREHKVASLVIVAPPRALGVLRKHLSPALSAVVTDQINKDYAQLSVHEIQKHLTAQGG